VVRSRPSQIFPDEQFSHFRVVIIFHGDGFDIKCELPGQARNLGGIFISHQQIAGKM
jgi:hypothetical protein